jgi:hypothetical protein
MSAATLGLTTSHQEELRNTYIHYLHATAIENPFRPQQYPDLPPMEAPATFLINFLRDMATATPPLPITRHGMDATLDILFSHPALRPLLTDDHASVALQQYIADTIIPTAPAVFAAHWTHIIRPAWDQHRELQRVLAVSGQA